MPKQTEGQGTRGREVRPEPRQGRGEPAASPTDRSRDAGGQPAAIRKVYLHPGRLVVCDQPCAVTTILGSCVAVCLWDPRLRVGGVSHYVLPHWAGPRQSSPRFGNLAIEQLIEQLLALGSRQRDLRAKLFGGARLMDSPQGEGPHLGLRNVQVAREVLAREGIEAVAEDVGGQGGRKLVFRTDDGSVSVRRF